MNVSILFQATLLMTALQEYARELRQDLPADVYRPATSRLLWLIPHSLVIGCGMWAIIGMRPHWGWCLGLSLLIGHSFACLSFLAHEILHGSVVQSRWMMNLFGGYCFLPHCLPPDVWKTWHNRFHHGYTGIKGKDPDGFGDPVLYRRSWLLHTILTFLPGSGYLRSAFYFVFYFSFHVLFVLFLHSRKYNYWSAPEWRRQVAYFAMEVAFWATVGVLVGPRAFLFMYVLPLMVANTIQMTYVTTNHWLCDETHDHNDPLTNSLSVKLPRVIDWLHLNTSYHTEHHLAPVVNPRHAPKVHNSMAARYGDRLRRLPLLRIMWMTYSTPRVHLSESELVDLNSGKVYSTLGPHGEPPELVDRVPVPVKRRKKAATEPNELIELAETEVILPFPRGGAKPRPQPQPQPLLGRRAA